MSEASGSLLESFFIRLGVKTDLSGLERFEKHVGGIHHLMEALGIAVGIEYVKRIGEFIEHNVSAAAAVQELSEVTEISTEKIAAMDRAGQIFGVGSEAMHSALMGITQATGAAAAGMPRYTALFKAMGIDAKKTQDPLEVLGKVVDKLKGKGPALQAAYAGRLGIDPVLMSKLVKEGEEFWERVREQRENGILKTDDYEKAHQTEIAFNRLHQTISQIVAVVGIKLAPIVERVTNAFQAWWKVNGPAVLQEFEDDMAYVVYYFKLAWTELGHIEEKAWAAYKKFSEWVDVLSLVEGVIAVIIGMKLGAWLAEVISLVGALSKALWALAANPWVVLIALGIWGLISIAQQLYENWAPITQWFGEQWDGLLAKVKDFAEFVLRFTPPGWLLRLWAMTGGKLLGRESALEPFLADQAKRHNDQQTIDEQAAYASSRYAPTSIDEASGIGVWKLNHNTSTTHIDTVNIAADKGREATVGAQLKQQINDAQGRVRDAQGPFKS